MTTSQSEAAPAPRKIDSRLIDPGTPPTRFARGWHCLGLADTFRDGKPHTVRAFGTKLVVWADTAGDLQVIDGYWMGLSKRSLLVA